MIPKATPEMIRDSKVEAWAELISNSLLWHMDNLRGEYAPKDSLVEVKILSPLSASIQIGNGLVEVEIAESGAERSVRMVLTHTMPMEASNG